MHLKCQFSPSLCLSRPFSTHSVGHLLFVGVPTTLTTQVQPTRTVSISNLTVVASGTMDKQVTTTTTIVTNKATIVPTKTLSTASQSSSIPPTARMTPEKLVILCSVVHALWYNGTKTFWVNLLLSNSQQNLRGRTQITDLELLLGIFHKKSVFYLFIFFLVVSVGWH